jgi:DNA-directed RNA polymerase sigma subunit (sigma70/sigma32)
MDAIKNLAITVQEMAHQLGDDFGFEDSTVEYIASEMQISMDEVREILDECEE